MVVSYSVGERRREERRREERSGAARREEERHWESGQRSCSDSWMLALTVGCLLLQLDGCSDSWTFALTVGCLLLQLDASSLLSALSGPLCHYRYIYIYI